MRSRVLGFDLDGTIYDWHTLVYEQLKRDFGLTLSYYEFWKDEWRKPYYQKLFENIVLDASLYGKAMVLPIIKEVLDELDKYYDIFYSTQRPLNADLVTRLWLKKSELPNYSNVYIVKDKISLIRELDCAFYVEDRIELAHRMKLLTNVIIINRPWNEGLCEGFITIDSIEELPDLLYKLDKDLHE